MYLSHNQYHAYLNKLIAFIILLFFVLFCLIQDIDIEFIFSTFGFFLMCGKCEEAETTIIGGKRFEGH